MIMCVLLCYPVSIHMSQLLSTGRPISSSHYSFGISICWDLQTNSASGHILFMAVLVKLNPLYCLSVFCPQRGQQIL